jgi:hypothetical protein
MTAPGWWLVACSQCGKEFRLGDLRERVPKHNASPGDPFDRPVSGTIGEAFGTES